MIVEELVVLAFVVVTLRQAKRPWWEVTTVALVLRGAYHIYYGPGVVGILVWAALFYWIYLRFRQLIPMILCHVLWDAVAFLGRLTTAVVGVGLVVVVALWITSGILWLVDRGNRAAVPYLWTGPPGDGTAGAWDGVPGWGVPGTGAPGTAAPGTPGWPAGGRDGRYGGGPSSAVPVPGVAQPATVVTGVGSVGAPAVVGQSAVGQSPVGQSPVGQSAVGQAAVAPPGWHPDPAGHNRWRWWDGQRWTEHVSSHS